MRPAGQQRLFPEIFDVVVVNSFILEIVLEETFMAFMTKKYKQVCMRERVVVETCSTWAAFQ